MHKIKKIFPIEYVQILQSYITGRLFRIKHEEAYSSFKEIRAGVPQGSVLGPVLYLLYTCDIPKTRGVTLATFADDTALLATGTNNEEAAYKLQTASNALSSWTKKWRIQINETKSIHINFTNKTRLNKYVSIKINNKVVPYSNTAKYLGMNLDAKLKWKEHIKKKRKELNIRYKKIYWMLGRKSQMSTQSKLLLYNQILKPLWTYGAQLWGCASKTSIKEIQTFQNKVLRDIVGAPWYVRNDNLHRDLNIPTVKEEIKRLARNHQTRLLTHSSRVVHQLLDVNVVRRLQRTKPFELCRVNV